MISLSVCFLENAYRTEFKDLFLTASDVMKSYGIGKTLVKKSRLPVSISEKKDDKLIFL